MEKRKKDKKKDKLELKYYLPILLIIFLVILMFTLIDFLIHSLSEEYAVPDYYFRNKIIFGTIIGFITYLLVRNRKLFARSLILSAAVSILLQIRYFLEGYPLKFVIEFLVFHFSILLPVSLIFFKVFDKFLEVGKFRQ